MISRERLAARFAAMERITAESDQPGIFRLAFTDSDWKGRSRLIEWMEEADLSLHTDAFGNVIGRRAGRDNVLPAVMFGSHGDSVPGGGNFDGVFGILAAIEVMTSLKEDGFISDHPLEAVLFMCEESSRFSAATLGSRAMCGKLSVTELHRLKDVDGASLYDVLKNRGLDPEKIGDAAYTAPLKAFFEVHIEQGKVLEATQCSIGVVTGIAAPTRLRVHLHGHADHSGATPMDMRQDGSCAAAEIILLVEKLAAACKEPPAVGTVGVIQVSPGAMNVIPGEVTLGIDIRSISRETKDTVVRDLKAGIAAISERRHLPYDIKMLTDESPVMIAPAVVNFLSQLCQEAGHPFRRMPSGAGHDAMHWAARCPTGMLFIPCRGGISHNPEEYASLDDIVRGTELLEAAVRRVSHRDFSF